MEKTIEFIHGKEEKFTTREIGILKLTKNLIECFSVLEHLLKNHSLQAILSMHRTIIDNYSVLYLITEKGTLLEKDIRYKLFLLDAINSKHEVVNKFKKDSEKDPKKYNLEDNNKAIEKDLRNKRKFNLDLEKFVNNKQLAKNILTQNNWKFKDILNNGKQQNKNRYNWIDLYQIARIPEHHSFVFQKYYSSFTHGLGLSIFTREENEILPFIATTYTTTALIGTITIEMLIKHFKINTRKANLSKNLESSFVYANKLWPSTNS
ncbi:hypothetical protein WNY78_04705 [Psychroserpens sp. AS72]|uniref:hypothetical protein n=1 Tax=Psychroserpens sp. AS72 TaxID=3135775 RepID=UPI0031785AEC